MSDAELRRLQRRWEEAGGLEEERALLIALRRHGRINDLHLELARDCGSAAALELFGHRELITLNAAYWLRKASPGTSIAQVASALQRTLGDGASDAALWAELEVLREQEPEARDVHDSLRRLLEAPSPEGLEELRRVSAAGSPQQTSRLAERCLEGRQTSSLSPPLFRSDRPMRGFLSWVLSGPLGRPTVADVRRQRDGREITLRLVASPPFVASLDQLAAWLERANAGDAFRFDRTAERLDLPGEGPLEPEATFAALADHLGPQALGFTLLFTERADAHDWFARHEGPRAVIHVDAFVRKRLRTPNLVYAAHMAVKKALDMGLERWARWAVPGERGSAPPLHEESRGCLFDLCRQKAQLDHRIRAGSLCPACRTYLVEERGLSEPILAAVEQVLEAGRREVLGR